ncbi:xanthine phosphoribosyltransferase [Angelakisella massiliensis]|uniref:xanthine phosphoribosyltransferase n=1 Tax=Angelakisella massiliensis TaxID=1871018 RepID=UPI0008F926F9|nr:xanthine phosphoribosyltransferase [Angelakisella massiliensis]
MKLLEERIKKDGVVKAGNILKVDSFLNHQMDVELYQEIGKEFYRLFGDCGVTKILTIEASGIGIACVTAQYFHVPALFAKKTKTKNIDGEIYTSQVESFTHGTTYQIMVSKRFLGPEDTVLILDDFLAKGNALMGLIDVVGKAGAKLAGCGIVIEKGFQEGGRLLREKGIRLESLAIIDSMNEKELIFREQ